MRMQAMIGLLVVAGIVTLSNLSNVHAQEQQTTKPSLLKLGTERPELSLQLLSGEKAPTWQALEGQALLS